MAENSIKFKVKKGLDVLGDSTMSGNLDVAGILTAVNQPATDNSTKVANTAFVKTAVANLIATAPAALDTLNELALALGNDPNFATTVTNNLALKAPLASPTLTGVPLSTTAAPGTSTTQIATTEFVTTSNNLKAPLASPNLTGIPLAPTASVNTSNNQLATTAFVLGQASNTTPLMAGIAAIGSSFYYSRQDHVHASDVTKASLSGATFTGSVTVNQDILQTGAYFIRQTLNDLVLQTDAAKDISFRTNAIQRMVLKNSGNLLINTAVDNGLDNLQVNGSVSATNFKGTATLTGTPTAPTAAVDTNTNQLATTGFVIGQGYTKTSTAQATYAPLASPALTGTPTAPTASTADNTTTLATTAFVKNQSYITSAGAPVQSVAGRTGAVVLSVGDVTNAATSGANSNIISLSGLTTPLSVSQGGSGSATATGTGSNVLSVSPALTGVPTAPTPANTDNTTALATTAFVKNQSYATVAGSVASFNTRTGAVTLTSSDVTGALAFTPVSTSVLAQPSGVATLDASGKLLTSQIPSSVVGAVVYQGTWNASTNTPSFVSGVGTKGYYYKVSVAGSTTIDGISQWNIGDTIIFDGTTWDKIDGIASEVVTVAGRTGSVVLTSADVSGVANSGANSNITSLSGLTTPLSTTQGGTGTTSTTGTGSVVFSASPALTGLPTAPTVATADNSTSIATTAFVKAQGYGTGTGSVTSVAGRTGAVVLTVADVSGAATSGANSNITALTGLVTPVSLPAGSSAPGILGSTSSAVTAAGTTQATAASLTSDLNIITTATANQGVVVSGTPQGKYAVIVNRTAVSVFVYPAVGHSFDGLATNAPITLPSLGFLEMYGSTTTQWHTTFQAITQGTFVSGNIPGNAANVTGTVAVANGGTGVTTSTGTGSTVLSISPALTGAPTAPTPATADNSTTVATTAYVKSSIAVVGNGTRTTNLTVATAGQTIFTVPGGYAATLIDVRLNGYSLAASDYVATNGTSITLLTAANLNDEIETVVFASQNFASGSTLTTQAIVATDQQTTFTIAGGYVVGLITVYQNGLRLPSNEYTATNGTTVVLALPVPLSTEMFFEIFSAVAFTSSVAKTGGTMSGPLVVNSTFSSQSTGDGTSSIGFRNRIINGDMRIDQRNNGAAVTPTGNAFFTDRFRAFLSQSSKLTFQQVTDAPVGFKNSLKISVNSQYAPASNEVFQLSHQVEGLNIIDFSLGTANATQITFSSYIKSSVEGIYAVSITNGAANRSYVGTVNVTNTWSQIVVNIPGDVTGTWNTDNTTGLYLRFDLGSGSGANATPISWQVGNLTRTVDSVTFVNQVAGSTLNITGIQLEAGSVATPFDRVNYGQQLVQCQRYFEIFGPGALDFIGNNFQASQNNSYVVPMKVTKRATPTFTSSWTLTNASTPTVISVDPTYIELNTINTGAGQWRITSSSVSSISAEL